MDLQALCTMLVLAVSTLEITSAFHLEIEYGNFEDLTCYTCPMKKDNVECNKWAPNIPCPRKHTVCKTVHLMDKLTGESVQVDKLCSLPEHCTNDHVGCTVTESQIECVSCCAESYCNVAVPYNITTSVKLSHALIASSSNHMTSSFYMTSGIIFVWILCVLTYCTLFSHAEACCIV